MSPPSSIKATSSAPFSPRCKPMPSSCPSTTACSTASGQVLVSDNQGHILFRGSGPIQLGRYNDITELIPTDAPILHRAGDTGLVRRRGAVHATAARRTTWRTASWKSLPRNGTSFPSSPKDTLTANVGAIQREVLYLMLVLHRLEHGVPLARAQDAGPAGQAPPNGPSSSSKRSSRTSPAAFSATATTKNRNSTTSAKGSSSCSDTRGPHSGKPTATGSTTSSTRKTANACSTPSTARSSTATTIPWSTA